MLYTGIVICIFLCVCGTECVLGGRMPGSLAHSLCCRLLYFYFNFSFFCRAGPRWAIVFINNSRIYKDIHNLLYCRVPMYRSTCIYNTKYTPRVGGVQSVLYIAVIYLPPVQCRAPCWCVSVCLSVCTCLPTLN